jgi:DNA-binding LytR/AlgR family response regulator
MTSLIADDESAARSRLTRMLGVHPNIEIVGEACDGLQALQAIETLRPDLVFLDIQMPGLDGFEMLRSIPEDVPRPLVVFVTGFDQHALEAFEANALAYLLKPVEKERLAAVIDRAASICEYGKLRNEEDRRVTDVSNTIGRSLKQIVGRKRDRIVLLAPQDVHFFSAEGGSIKAKTSDEVFSVNYQLSELETGLAESNFFRARRAVLVNLDRVKEIRPYFKSSFLLVMNDSAQTGIQVSERQAKILRQRIPGL